MSVEIFSIIMAMAAVTFFTRFASLILLHHTGIPAWFEKWLKHVPVGILTALIMPSILVQQGQINLSLHNHYLVAGIIAAIVAYKSRSAILTMGLGMGAMFMLRWIKL